MQMEKHLIKLNDVLESNETVIEWILPTEELAVRFIYRLRQAIHTANKLGISPFNKLSKHFQLRQRGKKVEAEIKYSQEFQEVSGEIKANDIMFKSPDTFELIRLVSAALDDETWDSILLLDTKESSMLIGWIKSKNLNYEVTNKGIYITRPIIIGETGSAQETEKAGGV